MWLTSLQVNQTKPLVRHLKRNVPAGIKKISGFIKNKNSQYFSPSP
jgi:hypothetical protein